MKFHLQHRLAAALCFAALCLTGCVSPNARLVEIGLVSARANFHEGKATFYQIEIHKPLDLTAPYILLRLPDGKILDRKSFTYPGLKQAGFMVPEGGYLNPNNSYSHELSRYGASFFFSEGELVMMQISQTTGPSVSIAGERKKVFRTLPLSQEDLELLFGRPDKAADKYQF